MLVGKQVRVRSAKNRLVPLYLKVDSGEHLAAARQLIACYRLAPGRTRGEIEDDLKLVVGEGPGALIHQGLAKLLEDRCEFEVASELTPEALREAVFESAAKHRADSAKAGVPFDRTVVLAEVSQLLALAPESVDRGLFADLKNEQRALTFDDCAPEFLLNRYNVALAQALLLRSTGMEVRVWGETPARFRQLFRAIKFHKLIATIRSDSTPFAPRTEPEAIRSRSERSTHPEANSYTITLDGPLSLFSSTQKYGLQLALFLPAILHCKAFELKADVRWGAERVDKTFVLSGADGLKSHLPDFGVYTPREIGHFEQNFRDSVDGWLLESDPAPQTVEGTVWVPDFTLTHSATGQSLFVEVLGFWRKMNIEAHYQRLKRGLPGKFLLVISEAYRADETDEVTLGNEVYRYKRTPSAGEVARLAAGLLGVTTGKKKKG